SASASGEDVSSGIFRITSGLPDSGVTPSASRPSAAALAAPAAAGATAKRQGAQPPQQLANAGAIAPAADR
ncbi:hypothetical protein ISG22_13400, partial [Burkholderia pseudomallei]|nr:hypothetical protein [Burkholderia pseudomallei]